MAKARSTILDLDSHNKLTFMRLKTEKYEILIAPDNEFILIVVQGQKNEGAQDEEVWSMESTLFMMGQGESKSGGCKIKMRLYKRR